jgi:hypothetical protein
MWLLLLLVLLSAFITVTAVIMTDACDTSPQSVEASKDDPLLRGRSLDSEKAQATA